MRESALFPMFVKLAGRRCVVVGGGPVAEAKVESLLGARAGILVVAPEATQKLQELARQGTIQWFNRPFMDHDLANAFLAIAATDSSETNAMVFRECHRQGVLCNAVDDPEHCDFYYGAVVRRGPLQIAISTGGKSPGVASRLRGELEQQFGPEYDAWLAYVAEARAQILADNLPAKEKKAQLERLASRASFEQFVSSRYRQKRQ
jgi:precorrin-2 dehydrogenase/sirohydrochlorin ferrochelatase